MGEPKGAAQGTGEAIKWRLSWGLPECYSKEECWDKEGRAHGLLEKRDF